jgi:uncharacterized membrane protein YdbT with pleckstrin-like domain
MTGMFTTAQIAELTGYYRHQVMRVVDDLALRGGIVVSRVCRVRLIPATAVPVIQAELARHPGWARRPETAGA